MTQLVQDVIILLKNNEDFSPDKNIIFQESADHLIFTGDEQRVKQVIWNLRINALEAMTTGTLTIKLKDVSAYHNHYFQANRRGWSRFSHRVPDCS